MADRYWVGGTGTWDATTKTNWAKTSGGTGGQSVPSYADSVFFDGNSGVINVTTTVDIVCFNFTMSANQVTTFKLGGNLTITRLFTSSTSYTPWRPLFASSVPGVVRTLTSAGLLLSDICFQDIVAAGAIPFTGTRIGDCGNNSNITFTTAKTVYMVNIAAQRQNGNAYALTSGGAANGVNFPLPQDICVCNNSSGGGGQLTGSVGTPIYMGSFDCSTCTNGTGFTGTGDAWNFYGDMKLGPNNAGCYFYDANAVSNGNAFSFVGRSTQTITSYASQFQASITINKFNSSVVLADNYIAAPYGTNPSEMLTMCWMALVSGTLDLNGKTFGPIGFKASSGTTLAIGTGNIIQSYSDVYPAFGWIVWDTSAANVTITGTNLTINSNNISTFSQATYSLGVNSPLKLAITGSKVVRIASANDIDFTGFTGTLLNNAYTVGGNCTFSSTMSMPTGTAGITFSPQSKNVTIKTNGAILNCPVNFNSVNGFSATLQDALNLGVDSTSTFTLSSGTLDFNNYNLTAATFNSNSSNIRYLKNCATITLLNSGVTIWDTTTTTGLTIDGTPIINCTYSGAVGTRTISSGILPSPAQIPTINISAGADIIVLPGAVNNINFTGFAGIWNNAAITLYGNLTLSSGMTLGAGTNTMTFANITGINTGTKTITTAAKTLDFPVTFNGLGLTYNLQDAMTIGATRTLTLTAGTVNTQGFNLTTGLMNVSGTTYRTLNMGTGVLTLSGVGTVWDATTSTALFYTIPSIMLSDTSVTGKTFTGGGIGYQKLTIGGTTGTSTLTINGSNAFEELASTKTVAHTILFADSSTQTIGKWSATGTVGNVITMDKVTTTAFNILLLGPSVSSVDYLSISNCTVSPLSIGKFYAGVNSANTINNTNILFSATPAAVTRYWVAGNGTWDTTTTTNWSATSGGAGGSTVPLLSDDVIFDTSSNATSYIVTVGTTATCANLTMDGPTSGTVTLSGLANSNTYIGSNFSLIGGPTKIINNYLGTLNLAGTNRWTCNTNGVILNSFNFIGLGSYITLLNNITSNATTTLTAGTINLNSYNVTTFAFNSNNNNVRNIQFANGVVNLTGNNTIIWDSTNAFNFNTTGTPTVNCAPIIISGIKNITGSWAPVNFITSSGSDIVSITSGNNFDFTGYAGTVYAAGSTVYGNVIFSSAGSIGAGSAAITFAGYQPAQNLNTQGLISDFPITINGLGSAPTTLQLLSNVTTNYTRTFTHTTGNLNLNGYNLTTGSYSTNNSNIRNINFGANTITLLNYNTTVWDSTTATNMGTTGTPKVNVAYSGPYGTRTITSSTAPVSFYITGGSDIFTINSGNDFNFTGFSGILTNSARSIYGNTKFSSTMLLMPGTLITTFIPVSANLTLQTSGITLEFPITIAASNTSLQLSLVDNCNVSSIATTTLTSGVFDLNGFTLSTGMFNSNNANVRRLANSNNALILTGYNNTVWDTTTMTNMVVSNSSNIIVNSYSSNGFTIIIGSTLANTIFKVSGTNYVSPSSGYTFDFTNFTGTLPNLGRAIYGSWILSPTMKLQSGITMLTFAATSGSNTITSAGQIMDFPITFAGAGGTWLLNGDLTLGSGLSKTLTLTNGTLNANNFNVSAGAVWSNNGNARRLVMGSGTWSLTGKWLIWDFATTTNLTQIANTSSISITNTSTATRYFNSGYLNSAYFNSGTILGNVLYNTVNIGGATGNSKFVITGSAYYKGLTTSKTQGLTMLFNNGSSVVENFLFNGSAGNYITLANLDPYGTFSLIKSTTGPVSSNFLNIANSVVYPASTWYAGSNSVDYGNNTNWVNLSTPPQSPMQFLTMF